MISILHAFLASILLDQGGAIPSDSTTIVDIEEIVVVAPNKQTSPLRRTATSASLFGPNDIRNARVQNLSNLGAIAPNFFMPQYGSRLSSSCVPP